MTKNIIALLTLTSIILSFASTALADGWTGGQVVKQVYVRDNSGTPTIEVTTVENEWGQGCNEQQVWRTADDSTQKMMVSLALAAFLSGKEVRVYTGSDCEVHRIEVIN